MDAPSPLSSPGLPNRRGLLYGGASIVAAAAGAGLAWWQFDADHSSAAVASLWNTAFETPQGAAIPMSAFRGKPLLINFWATWCPPCVEELPLVDAFFRQNSAKGWHVLGLAIDQPSAVRAFLKRTPVSFPIGLAGLEGTQLGKSLGNGSGGLPYTIVLSSEGNLAHRRIGRLSQADLSAWSAGA